MKPFGSKELCKCLENLGFSQGKRHATSHVKYKIPVAKKIPQGKRPFIMVQLGKKRFDKNSCSRYLSEIKQLGFTKEEIKASRRK